MIRSTMEFYNPTVYHTDLTDYDSSYDSYYDYAQTEPPIPQSSNEPSFYNLLDYPPPCYFGEAYDSGVDYSADASYGSNFRDPVDDGASGFPISYSAYACSASTFSVPKVIEYDPQLYGDGHQKVSTQFVMSYSVAEFNEPDFEEYDPTPYDGGYDICQTYGKPLPPSNEICYPPNSSSSAPKPPPPIEAIAVPIESQKGKEEVPKEAPKGKIEEQTKPPQIQEDDISSSESDTGEEIEAISWADPGGGYENGRGVRQFPSGYGLEAMDLCETLFGYWPCLSRAKKQTDCRRPDNRCGHCHCHGHWHGTHNNQWQIAADYLFGSHYPYADGRGQGQGGAS